MPLRVWVEDAHRVALTLPVPQAVGEPDREPVKVADALTVGQDEGVNVPLSEADEHGDTVPLVVEQADEERVPLTLPVEQWEGVPE